MAAGEQEPYQAIRKILPFTTALVIMLAIYVGYIVFSRWKERHDLAERATHEQVENARKTVEAYGNGQVKVMNFTISPGVLRRGDRASICYGVSNAKSVSIEPKPDDNVWPSLARCVAASPKKTTTYTITAQDANGHSDTQSLTINVQ